MIPIPMMSLYTKSGNILTTATQNRKKHVFVPSEFEEKKHISPATAHYLHLSRFTLPETNSKSPWK